MTESPKPLESKGTRAKSLGTSGDGGDGWPSLKPVQAPTQKVPPLEAVRVGGGGRVSTHTAVKDLPREARCQLRRGLPGPRSEQMSAARSPQQGIPGASRDPGDHTPLWVSAQCLSALCSHPLGRPRCCRSPGTGPFCLSVHSRSAGHFSSFSCETLTYKKLLLSFCP